jgi:lipoate-protein ligase A
VLPRSHPLYRRNVEAYRVVHQAIVGVMAEAGASASRRGDVEPLASEAEDVGVATAKPFLCFLDRDPEDLVLDGAKIVGSAQRRRSGGLLQHGSLLLARSPETPELPGLRELAGLDADPAAWAERLTRAIAAAIGFAPTSGGIQDDERRRAEALAAGVYHNPAWTERR